MISFDLDQLLILMGPHLLRLIVMFFIFSFLLKKIKHNKKIAFIGALIVNFIIIPATGSHQQLITDEQMLTHFKEHRFEMETLMHDYLTNPEEWGSFKNASPELKALQKKASVDRMAYKYNAWHENPYSLEAAIQYRQDVNARIIDTVHDRSRQDVYVSLTVKGARVFYKRWAKTAYKEFLYIPQLAKVENGKLLYPISDIHPERIGFEVISESLDQVPDWLLPGDCTMKRIDDHWFLSLCLTS